MNIRIFLFSALLISLAVCEGIENKDIVHWNQWTNSNDAAQPDTTPGQGAVAQNSDCDNLSNDDLATAELTVLTGDSFRFTTTPNPSCWDIDEAQDCFDELGKLDNEGYYIDAQGTPRFGDLVNSCNARETVVAGSNTGDKVYDFLLTWMTGTGDDYLHNDNCVEQEINFIDTTEVDANGDALEGLSRQRYNVPPSNSAYIKPTANDSDDHAHDMWWYSSNTGQIFFSIDSEDLQNLWGCSYTETPTEYQWVCDIELNIFFAGEIQFTYQFQMISTLDRTVTDSLVVAVNRNVVTGDCCVNTLQVESSLHFCSNYDCVDGNGDDHLESSTSGDDGWVNGVKNVERKEKFWIAHRIDTSEFQNYYLEPVSVKIGPFVPKIHQWKQVESTVTFNQVRGDTTFLTIFELESYVALDKLSITAISLLDDKVAENLGELDNVDDPQTLEGFGRINNKKRILEEGSTVGTDYKIKGEETMSVVDKTQESKEGDDDNDKVSSNSVILSFGLALFLVFALL